jgi:hypothetical protein
MFGGGGNALLLDGFQYLAPSTSTLVPVVPSAGARDVPLNVTLAFQLTSGAIVDVGSLQIIVAGEVAYVGGAAQPGWLSTVATGSTIDVTLKRIRPFARDQHVTVEVDWVGGATPMTGTFAFDTMGDGDCWAGSLTAFEATLNQTLPLRNLDLLRSRLLYASTTSKAPTVAARSVVQMAFDTEIGIVLDRLVVLAEEIFTSRVCERRKYIDIDADIQPFNFLVDAALDELEADQRIPEPYLRLYRQHVKGPYPRYRVCGLSALMCLASYYYLGAGA